MKVLMTITSNPNEPIFYVYVLVDPRHEGSFVCGKFTSPYRPFYIGKGKGLRFKSHSLRSSKLVKNKINAIKIDTGKSHKVKILETGLTELQAYRIESKLIKSVGLKMLGKGPLLNMNEGGPGIQQGCVSDVTRNRRSASLKKYWDKVRADKKAYAKRIKNMGGEWTEEQRENQSLRKSAYYESTTGVTTRELLAKATRKIAASRTVKEVEQIYDKQRATRQANRV